MKRNLAFLTSLLLFVFCFASSGAHAQINARIKGTVTDPTGAVVAGATVVATNEQTGVKSTTTSSASGDYLFPQLPIGTYDISASASGFKGFSATGITLNIDQEYVKQIKLSLGSGSEQVQVEADAVQVNTTDMQMNNVVNAAQMEELPLIGRSFTGLELTLPGVANTDTRFGGTYSVSGAQAQQSEYLINGADTNDIALNTIALTPNLDAIAEFNLIDGPLNAEYDRNSGGIVTATIVQGTNHFHGDAFEFYRDTFLNTANFFQKAYAYNSAGVLTLQPGSVSPYHQHIFGGTVGGPVFKDKLFFFGAYQGTRQRVPQSTSQNTVYSTTTIAGNYSAELDPTVTTAPCLPSQNTTNTPCNTVDGIFQADPIPSTINIAGCTTPGETFAQCAYALNGRFPTASFNPITTKLISTYLPPVTASNGYTYNSISTTTGNQYIGRVDFSPNAKNQITVLGIYQQTTTANGLPFSGASVPGFGDGSLSHIQQWTLDYTRQLSSSLVNDLAAHYTRFNFNSGAPQKVMQPSSAGFSITPQDPASATLPQLGVSGFFTLGGTNNGPQPRIDQVIQLDDNVSKTFGHHNVKFGYDGRRFNVSNTFDASNSGAYGFSSSGSYSTGDASLDFLLGIPSSFSQGTGSIIQADAFLNYIYGQDSWRVTNNFTFNYGLGYSLDTPLRNHQFGGLAVSCLIPGQQSKIFPGAPLSLNYPGDPGCTNAGQAYTRHTEFGPRIGFAWAPDLGWLSGSPGKFSIRAGYGIYYNRTEEESALQTLGTPPFGFTSNGAGDFGGNASLANPFVDINGGNDPTGASLGAKSESNRFPYTEPTAGQAINYSASGLLPVYNISSFDKSFRAPYSENIQLSAEREFPSRMVARVSYVASLGRHNQVAYEGNPETAAGHTACAASSTCIANRVLQNYYYPSHTLLNNPSFIEEGEVGSYSSSNYNSLQISVTKAPTHGLLFQLSYTYSHALDDASSFENSGFGESGQRGYNQFQKSLNYGNSTFDQRQSLVFSPVYQAPLLHGHSTFSPINLALSGWEVSAVARFATGLPYDISYAGGSSNSLYCTIDTSFYACPDVPLQTAPLALANPRIRLFGSSAKPLPGHGQYFQKTSFAAEPIGSFGNIGRNPYAGPGFNNTNLILAKNFILSADGVRRLQLRMESDNVFNHTQFSNPSSSFSDSVPGSSTTSFGQISSAATARQTQLAAKFYF
jgi:hypothetical protein